MVIKTSVTFVTLCKVIWILKNSKHETEHSNSFCSQGKTVPGTIDNNLILLTAKSCKIDYEATFYCNLFLLFLGSIPSESMFWWVFVLELKLGHFC